VGLGEDGEGDEGVVSVGAMQAMMYCVCLKSNSNRTLCVCCSLAIRFKAFFSLLSSSLTRFLVVTTPRFFVDEGVVVVVVVDDDGVCACECETWRERECVEGVCVEWDGKVI